MATKEISILLKLKDQMTGSLKKSGVSLTKYGASLTAFGASMAVFGSKSLQAYDKQAKAIAQVEGGLKSTQGTVGKTLEELKVMASDLQKNTIFGDEVILKDATAQLLTFTNITGDQFGRTQEAALDLATRLDGDLKSASIQLGKALNDPVANLSALSRSGIQFSEDQKTLINSLWEAGQQAEAQALILDELDKQYGGSAEAALAGLGPLEQMKNSFGDMQEAIGEALIPSINNLIEAVKPAIEKITEWVKENPAVATTIAKIVAVVAALAVVLGPILILLPALTAGFALLMGPIGLVTVAVVALISAGVLLMENWDYLVLQANIAWEAIKITIEQIGVSIKEFILSVWQSITTATSAVWNSISDFLTTSFGDIKTLSVDTFTEIGSFIMGIWDSIVGKIEAVVGRIKNAIQSVKDAANKITGKSSHGVDNIPAGMDAATLLGGQRAQGGTVMAGSSYLVGERGPEMFTPLSSGKISPNTGGGGITVNITGNNFSGNAHDIVEQVSGLLMNRLQANLKV